MNNHSNESSLPSSLFSWSDTTHNFYDMVIMTRRQGHPRGVMGYLFFYTKNATLIRKPTLTPLQTLLYAVIKHNYLYQPK